MARYEPEEITTSKGTRYRVRWTDTNDRDRERRFPTKKAAQDFKAQVEADKSRGTYQDHSRGRTPFATVAEEWLQSLGDTSERTRNEYRRILTARVLPAFGSRSLASIKRSDADQFWQAMRAEGLRPQTIRRAWHPFQATLAYAVTEEYIARSPARGVKLPKDRGATRYKGRRLPWPDVQALAQAADALPRPALAPPPGLIVRLLATTGLRPAELAGLSIADVTTTDTAALLTVQRTRTLVKALGWVEGDPKTDTSREVVPGLVEVEVAVPHLSPAVW